MLKLPYKTQPQEFEKVTIGNAEIGEIEVPKIGDLSPNERVFIKQVSKGIGDLRKMAVSLAKDIANKSGMKLLEVYDALISGDAAALGEYLEEFIAFQEALENNQRQRTTILATAMIKMRICPDWDIENTGNPEQIHPKLIEEIADFARKEESGWQETEEQSEVTEEDLGKSSKKKTPTGKKSTGESKDTGETIAALAASDSDSSQPG